MNYAGVGQAQSPQVQPYQSHYAQQPSAFAAEPVRPARPSLSLSIRSTSSVPPHLVLNLCPRAFSSRADARHARSDDPIPHAALAQRHDRVRHLALDRHGPGHDGLGQPVELCEQEPEGMSGGCASEAGRSSLERGEPTMSSSAKGCAIYPRLFPCHSSRARRENRIPVNLDERRAGRSRSPRRQTYRARACPIGPSSRASHPLHVPAAESARQRWEAGPLSSASPSTRLRRRRTLSALCATVEFSFGRASWGSSCAPSLCAARSDNHGEQRDEELCVAGKSETSAGTSSPACRPLVLLTSRFAR